MLTYFCHGQYPLHLLNLSSVEDLDTKITDKDDTLRSLDPRRFRANIIGQYLVFPVPFSA